MRAPHSAGKNHDNRENDDEPEGLWRIGENKRKRVHGRVKDGHGKEVAIGAIVEPREDETDGDEEDDANHDVLNQGETKRAVKVEWGVPESPGKRYENRREERGESLLKSGKEITAPAGLFENSGEKEIAQKGDGSIHGKHPERAVVARRDERAMQEIHDGRGDHKNDRPKEKRKCLPAPVRWPGESAKKLRGLRNHG